MRPFPRKPDAFAGRVSVRKDQYVSAYAINHNYMQPNPISLSLEEWDDIAMQPWIKTHWELEPEDGGHELMKVAQAAKFTVAVDSPSKVVELFVLLDPEFGQPPIMLERGIWAAD